jgi:RimJ/RimL family protein N-acetyltransferase
MTTTADTSKHARGQPVSSRTRSMLDGRHGDSMRRRRRVLAAIDQAAAAGDRLSASAIARAAAVDRTFLYRHPDLLEKIHALQANPVPDEHSSPAVTRASLKADLLAGHERTARLDARIHQLEQRLSQTLGEHTWRESGLGAPTDINALHQRISPTRTTQPRPSTTTRRTRRRPRRRPRHQPRTHGPTQHSNPAFKGRRQAFETMLDIPDLADKLVRTARQRLATDITPVPVRARDGTELLLRPVLPGDAERIANSPVWFSPDTLYRRFLSARTLSPAVLKYLTEVDYVDHFVWVVTDGIDGPVIADARFVRDHNDPALAEIAFTVADTYQGRGIGTLLVDALAVAARLDGVTRFYATVLADNTPARALLERLNLQCEPEGPGVVTATVDVPEPTHLPPNTVRDVRDMARQVIYAFD